MQNPMNWEFLNEPIYKWFFFVVGFGLLMRAWSGVLREITG